MAPSAAEPGLPFPGHRDEPAGRAVADRDVPRGARCRAGPGAACEPGTLVGTPPDRPEPAARPSARARRRPFARRQFPRGPHRRLRSGARKRPAAGHSRSRRQIEFHRRRPPRRAGRHRRSAAAEGKARRRARRRRCLRPIDDRQARRPDPQARGRRRRHPLASRRRALRDDPVLARRHADRRADDHAGGPRRDAHGRAAADHRPGRAGAPVDRAAAWHLDFAERARDRHAARSAASRAGRARPPARSCRPRRIAATPPSAPTPCRSGDARTHQHARRPAALRHRQWPARRRRQRRRRRRVRGRDRGSPKAAAYRQI